jgi:crotonobetainyl-CoA:carnitine CoA-transferase CaiB-like acyl-CoA transferase
MTHRDALEPALQELIAARKIEDLMAAFTAKNVPAGPVNTIGQMFEDPFIEARGTVHHFDREDGSKVPSVAYPGKLSATPARFERVPPHLGEDTEEVLSDWLGLKPESVAALVAAGAIAVDGLSGSSW